MAIGGFFGQLGLAAGRNIEVGIQQDSVQASTALKQQEAAQMKMQTLAMQQHMQSQKAIGDYLHSEQMKDQSSITDPAKSAQMYSKAADMAVQEGDFKSAEEMSSLAKGKLQEAKDAEAYTASKVAKTKDTLSTAAQDYALNPTSEGAAEVARSAVAAGVNPTTIPKPGTPEFKAWANTQALASMDAKSRAQFLEKKQETEARLKETRQAHQDSVAEREAARRDRAAYQSGMLQLRASEIADRQERSRENAGKAPTTKEVNGKTYEWDGSGKNQGTRDLPDKGWVQIGGAKQSVQQQTSTTAIVGSAGEALRGLRVIGSMPAGQSAGAFAGLHDGTILESLGKVGTNVLTPQSYQMYQTASAGLGLELGRILTLGGGRGVNQSQIHEFQNMTTVHPGDTEFQAMFKYANAADVIRNRLSTLPDSTNDKVLKHQKQIEQELEKIPTPEQVIAEAKRHGVDSNVLAHYKNMSSAAQSLRDGSMSGDNSMPADVASLVNKYGSK